MISGDANGFHAFQKIGDAMVLMNVWMAVMRKIVVSYKSFLLYSWFIILRFSYGRCIVSVIYFLCLFDFLDRSTAKKKPPSCEEICLTDWTAEDTPDCIKRDACKRACNGGTCTA